MRNQKRRGRNVCALHDFSGWRCRVEKDRILGLKKKRKIVSALVPNHELQPVVTSEGAEIWKSCQQEKFIKFEELHSDSYQLFSRYFSWRDNSAWKQIVTISNWKPKEQLFSKKEMRESSRRSEGVGEPNRIPSLTEIQLSYSPSGEPPPHPKKHWKWVK